MLYMIAKVYRSEPDVRTLDIEQIEFFYDGIRVDLKELTKPQED